MKTSWSKIDPATVPKATPLLLRKGYAADETPIVGFYDTLKLRWLPAHAGTSPDPIYPKFWATIPVFERPMG